MAARPYWRRLSNGMRLLTESWTARLALGAVLVAVILAIIAPLVTPQNPYDLAQIDVADANLSPWTRDDNGMLFMLGSDDQGRDLFSAVLFGLRTSLGVAFASCAIAMSIGMLVGLATAYYGGWLDTLLMRIVDIQLSLPAMLIALVLLAVFGGGLGMVILAIVTAQWAIFARTVRSAARMEAQKEYVAAARVLGFRPGRIMLRHIMPNSVAELGIIATVEMANAVALEATLSFLGVGLPVTQPSLGLLIANGYPYMLSGEFWLSFVPGLVLLAIVLAVTVLGDRMRRLRSA